MDAAASRPSLVWVGGIRMSMIARSGRSSRTRSISPEGVPDWPTTSKPERSSKPASPSRRRTSSSASTTCVRLMLTPPIMGYLDTMGTFARLAEFTGLVGTAIANSQTHEELTRLAAEQAALRRGAPPGAGGGGPGGGVGAGGAGGGGLVFVGGG